MLSKIDKISIKNSLSGTVMSLPIGHSHRDLINILDKNDNINNNEYGSIECGFLDENGKFLDRYEALVHALENEQLNKEGIEFLTKRLSVYFNNPSKEFILLYPGLDSSHLKKG